jgi:phage/plasmid-associated DNA primase
VDYETLLPDPGLAPARRVWVPLPPAQLVHLANTMQGLLLESEAAVRSYTLMIRQIAEEQQASDDRILIQTDQGLRELHSDGKLHDLQPDFCPHYIRVPLNNDPEMKTELFNQFVDWLGSEEDATSLLHHFATALAPSWPAVRYVLLIGEGRNGKSLIMKMLVDLFGSFNVSHVTRQQMSAKAPECHDLTNRLLNVVFDGEATYLKDSGMEKTLTAGEVAQIRRLFETYPSRVQTYGLFIEGLNREPKSSDKSSALQKRIVRFHLPNVYHLDHDFEEHMRSQQMLGALLSLMLDHYVKQSEVHSKLALTRSSIELKLEHSRVNDMSLQFLQYIDEEDPLGVEGLLDEQLPNIAQKFQAWRSQMLDYSVWSTADVESMLRPLFITDRVSKRIGGRPRKVRVTTSFKPDVVEFLDYIRGQEETTDEGDDAVVAERSVHDEQPAPSSSAG